MSRRSTTTAWSSVSPATNLLAPRRMPCRRTTRCSRGLSAAARIAFLSTGRPSATGAGTELRRHVRQRACTRIARRRTARDAPAESRFARHRHVRTQRPAKPARLVGTWPSRSAPASTSTSTPVTRWARRTRSSSALAQRGVNLLAFTAVPSGEDRAQFAVFPEDPSQFIAEARAAQIEVEGPHHALLVQGDDELGGWRAFTSACSKPVWTSTRPPASATAAAPSATSSTSARIEFDQAVEALEL